MSGFVPDFCASCRAVIVWCATPAGERMPVDYEPHPDGNLQLTRRRGDEPPLARVIKPALRFGRKDLRRSHFATCPDADQHRRRRKPPAGRWLVANSPTSQPYPCRCNTRAGCRQGGTHCPCTGRTDLDHLPKHCCAQGAAIQETE